MILRRIAWRVPGAAIREWQAQQAAQTQARLRAAQKAGERGQPSPLPAGAVEQVATVIRARRRRSASTAAHLTGFPPASRSTSGGQEAR